MGSLALDTLAILLMLDAGNQPVTGPVILQQPMSYEACVRLHDNDTYRNEIRAKLQPNNPKLAGVFVGCHRMFRDEARALGQRLLDGNP